MAERTYTARNEKKKSNPGALLKTEANTSGVDWKQRLMHLSLGQSTIPHKAATVQASAYQVSVKRLTCRHE